MKAVIYARQSSGDETLSESVELQIEKCRNLAQTMDLQIAGVYQDLNTSGKTYPDFPLSETLANMDLVFQQWYDQQSGHKMFRKGLGELIKNLSRIDVLLCYDITRLYRPISGSHLESHINQLLISNQVKILTVNNGWIDVGSFNDSLIVTLQARINHEHVALCRKKSMAAMNKLRDDGVFANGGKAFGITYLGNKKIEFDPRKKELIQYIFAEILKDVPYQQIVRYINIHYRDCFKKLCYRSNLYHIAGNPVYAGYMYDTQGNLIKNRQLDGLELIPLDVWQSVQKKMKQKRCRTAGHKNYWLPFSKILYDAYSGCKLVVGVDHGNIFYGTHIKYLQKQIKTCCNVSFLMNKKMFSGIYWAMYPVLFLSLKQREEKFVRQKSMFPLPQFNCDRRKNFNAGKNDPDWRQPRNDKNSYPHENGIFTPPDEYSFRCSLAKDFEQLLQQNISNEKYEQMIHDIVKRITVFDDKIIVSTIYGEIPLNRFLYANKKHFPRYTIRVDRPYYAEYLPFEFEETKIVVQYLYPSYYKGDRTVTDVLKIDNMLICFAGRNEL